MEFSGLEKDPLGKINGAPMAEAAVLRNPRREDRELEEACMDKVYSPEASGVSRADADGHIKGCPFFSSASRHVTLIMNMTTTS